MPHNILIATTHRLNNRAGGTERVLCSFANAMSLKGHKVYILYCDKHSGSPFFTIDKSISIINTYTNRSWFSTQFIRNLISFSPDKNKKYKKRKIIECKLVAKDFKKHLNLIKTCVDIAICFDFESAYIFKEIFHVEIPIITTLQTAPSLAFDSQKNDLFLDTINRCQALHVLMPDFEPECKKRFPNTNVVCIPNCIEPFTKEANYSQKKIICVSRYDPEKRPALLVEAFSLLAQRFRDWKVEFWGRLGGKNCKEIQNLIKQKKLDKQFKLCGVTNNIEEKLSQASIYVIPSEFEGFCLSLVEAMAVGLPSVGINDCPAVNSLIHNNSNGLLSKPTPEHLASSLEKLMLDATLRQRLGQQARIDSQKYQPNVVWQRWDNLIKGQLSVLKLKY